MMHPLTGPDNDGSTPLFLASGPPPVCIRSKMASSSPKSNKTSLSPFLLSKGACDAGKHEKNGAKKVHQMMPRASNDALGRIVTRPRPPRRCRHRRLRLRRQPRCFHPARAPARSCWSYQRPARGLLMSVAMGVAEGAFSPVNVGAVAEQTRIVADAHQLIRCSGSSKGNLIARSEWLASVCIARWALWSPMSAQRVQRGRRGAVVGRTSPLACQLCHLLCTPPLPNSAIWRRVAVCGCVWLFVTP